MNTGRTVPSLATTKRVPSNVSTPLFARSMMVVMLSPHPYLGGDEAQLLSSKFRKNDHEEDNPFLHSFASAWRDQCDRSVVPTSMPAPTACHQTSASGKKLKKSLRLRSLYYCVSPVGWRYRGCRPGVAVQNSSAHMAVALDPIEALLYE